MKLDESGELIGEPIKDEFLNATLLTKYKITLPPLLLDYGSYRMFLNVSMINATGISSINYTDFNIIKTPLHAEIDGAPITRFVCLQPVLIYLV